MNYLKPKSSLGLRLYERSMCFNNQIFETEVSSVTNYYELYRKHGLPLEEAYYLAEFKRYITKDTIVKDMVLALRKEICGIYKHCLSEPEGDICKRYMREKGYYDVQVPFVYQPRWDLYDNYRRPDNLKIRNKINYLELYKKGLVSLREAYVLAKNKNFLLDDNCMLSMIFAIENEIFKEIIDNSAFWSTESHYKVLECIAEFLSLKPRTQIIGSHKPIGWIIEIYMNDEGYTYEPLAYNSFIPIINE